MNIYQKIETIEQRFLELFPNALVRTENYLYGEESDDVEEVLSLAGFFDEYAFGTEEEAESVEWMADDEMELTEEDLITFVQAIESSLGNSNNVYQFEVRV